MQKYIESVVTLLIPSVQAFEMGIFEALIRILCYVPFLAWLCNNDPCALCTSSQYCQHEFGSCEATSGSQCVDIPFLFCPLVYLPVCGCDGNTYGNFCQLQSERVSPWYLGECCGDCDQANQFCEYPEGTCGVAQSGQCITLEENVFCTEQYDPVCGCDGVTYGNDCNRQGAKVSKRADGICCGTSICGFDSFCEAEGCDTSSESSSCVEIPDSCAAVIEPVCGCDGITYNNDCERQREGVSKQADGAC